MGMKENSNTIGRLLIRAPENWSTDGIRGGVWAGVLIDEDEFIVGDPYSAFVMDVDVSDCEAWSANVDDEDEDKDDCSIVVDDDDAVLVGILVVVELSCCCCGVVEGPWSCSSHSSFLPVPRSFVTWHGDRQALYVITASCDGDHNWQPPCVLPSTTLALQLGESTTFVTIPSWPSQQEFMPGSGAQ